MIKQVEIRVPPDKAVDSEYCESIAIQKSGFAHSRIKGIRLSRRSIDARGRRPIYQLRYDLGIDENLPIAPPIKDRYKNVSNEPAVHIVGAGPAGYFAGLKCLELGLKPIILERGKDVRARRRDLRAIQQEGKVNPHSNYCFGEGGAGTYSDGKLYTRSHKRGKIKDILQILVEHGAKEDILMDAHPHIGSNKLPGIVTAIRETIEGFGGEVWFDHHVVDMQLNEGRISSLSIENGKTVEVDHVVLATGHSSREVYYLLDQKGIYIEPKPFALGCRVEHPQSYVDRMQYNQEVREENLPAADYRLTCQADGAGVFSFCMCPGGLVVPAATAPGELLVNGMSLSRRDSPFANSGFVTSIEVEELNANGYTGTFACLDFQKKVEKDMFEAGDGSQKAPAQRVKDFVDGKLSPELNPTSYIPGLISAPLHEILPTFVYQRLRKGLILLDQKMKGYLTNEANIIATESRTSSTIRIPRDNDTLLHPDVNNLYPCGEGAGYAGGILSACMDGEKVIKAVKVRLDMDTEAVN